MSDDLQKRINEGREHDRKVQKTKPALAPGSKFASMKTIIAAGDDTLAGIISCIDEYMTETRCIEFHNNVRKSLRDTCAEQYGVNPKIFNLLVKTYTNNDHFDQVAQREEELEVLRTMMNGGTND